MPAGRGSAVRYNALALSVGKLTYGWRPPHYLVVRTPSTSKAATAAGIVAAYFNSGSATGTGRSLPRRCRSQRLALRGPFGAALGGVSPVGMGSSA